MKGPAKRVRAGAETKAGGIDLPSKCAAAPTRIKTDDLSDRSGAVMDRSFFFKTSENSSSLFYRIVCEYNLKSSFQASAPD